ncbi:hypothetical protein V865_003977 [Kwoniella europaea PYCC6329]|uniref:N-acetyltransferase domain-containing protein n=1 Tax=Kwoniella europaea PYCC6329 TaxID=1423913 RepID=A0AAX4KIJ1_9TREE
MPNTDNSHPSFISPKPIINSNAKIIKRPTYNIRPTDPRNGVREGTNEFLNLYQPDNIPKTLHANTPKKFQPFVPSKHLSGFLRLPPSSWTHVGELGPYTEQTALEDIESFRIDPRCLLLAVIDIQVERKGKDGFAGVYGLIEVNDEFMHAIFGLINILPIYQRTHINTHSMYLTLQYLFEDLNLIRVQYDAVTHNTPSINSAKKFGFKEEGICRNFNGLVPQYKKVNPKERERKSKSQDMWVASMTDHDWFSNVKDDLEMKVERPAVDTYKMIYGGGTGDDEVNGHM